MRLRRRSYRDKRSGRKQECSNWTVVFTDHNGTERECPAFDDRKASSELGRKLDRLVALHVAGEQSDVGMARWLEGLPTRLQRRLVRLGLIDARKAAGSKLLSNHLTDWKASLLAKGNTEKHTALVVSRARKAIEGCGFLFFSDLSASKVQQYLATMRQDTRDGQGISAQTFNFYLRAIKQFCRWLVQDRRVSQNPMAHLTGLNVRTDRRHDRRALTVEECRELLAATRSGPHRDCMSGPERAMLYQLALETGLRVNELRSLTPASFDLAAEPPTVTVEAAYAKNRRQDTLPLRPEIAAMLRTYLGGLLPNAPVFRMPDSTHTARMIRADAKAVGIPYQDENGRFADFHALRHTFITNLASSGVHPTVAKALARHSTITLTMDRYTHSLVEQRVDALAKLPDLSAAPETQPMRATGTDGKDASSDCPGDCPEMGGLERYSVVRGGLKASTGRDRNRNAARPRGTSTSTNNARMPAAKETAEGEGFEPPVPCGTAVFKTAAFVHSATPPVGIDRQEYCKLSAGESRVQRSGVSSSSSEGRSGCWPGTTSSNTFSSTYIGAPVCTAKAMASLGRESISMDWPSRTRTNLAKNVWLRRSHTTMR